MAISSSATRWSGAPRPRVISVTRRAARASSPRTGFASPSASCQYRYSARPVCLTTQTPSAMTMSVDGTGMMPADANDSGSHETSAPRQRQEATETVVEDEHGVAALHLDAASPVLDLASQLAGPGQLDQATLLHATPQRQQRRVEVGGAGEQPERSDTTSRGCGPAVSGRRDVRHPSNPVCSCGAPRSVGREWRSERASGWRRPRSAGPPRVLGVRPASGARSCGCRADRRRSGRLRRGAREHRRARRPHRVRVRIQLGGVDHQHRRAVAA